MLVMSISWVYAVFFFLPLLASIAQGTHMFLDWYHLSEQINESVVMNGRINDSCDGTYYVTQTRNSIAEFIPD